MGASKELKIAIDKLLKRKKEGEELSWGTKIPVINYFIEKEIKRIESKKFQYKKHKKHKLKTEKLNKLFRSSLIDIWGDYSINDK